MTMTEEELFENLRILEAVLFTAQDLQTEKELQQFFPEKTDVTLLLEHLQQHYQARGVNVVKRGNGWGLRTAPDLAEKLEVCKVEVRPMSRAALETLSIIAYHQPVTRPEIEQVRGVSIGKNIFEFLIAENLIKPGKRREVPGRPLTWITTQQFLDTFGLESLKELPNLQELRDAGLLAMTPPNVQPTLPLALDDQEAQSEQDEDNAADSAEELEAFEASFDTADTTQEGEAA